MNLSSFAVPVAGDVTETADWALRVVAVDPGDTGGAEADTPAVTTVAAAAADTLLLAANVNRKLATVYNDSSAILYLKLGTGASSTSFTVKMQGEGYYEVPASYNGALYGNWASATGSARVTEVV